MRKFWKNGKGNQRLLPITTCVCRIGVQGSLESFPFFVGRCYHSHFPKEETEVTFLVGGKTILPDSDTRIRHRARGRLKPLLLDDLILPACACVGCGFLSQRWHFGLPHLAFHHKHLIECALRADGRCPVGFLTPFFL